MNESIFKNIEISNLNVEEKDSLIEYGLKIDKNNCPIFFDKQHVLLTFNFSVEENIDQVLIKKSISYTKQKKNGALREVWQPSYKIKVIQRWILKNILEKFIVSEHAHGFIKNKSILTNAMTHNYDEECWILSLDIRNFFPSITIEQVRRIFLKVGYAEEVSNVLSQLCTINGKLVQGFPTSPYIANIVMKELDDEFHSLAKRCNLRYSRYADDLSFSSIHDKGYKKLAKKIVDIVESILWSHNFVLNKSKTRLMKKNESKKVTGLMITTKGIKIPTNYIKKLEKELYYCKRFGVSNHLKYNNKITKANYKGYITGMIRYVYMVDKELGIKYLKQLESINWD